MKRYKIVVAYDGTDFYGWQEQPSDVTIVSTLKKSFRVAFKKDVSILGASRTDAGVHALGQVAVCKTDLNVDITKNSRSVHPLLYAWNNSLPNSIVIRSIELADSDFHIFGDVICKTYHYNLFVSRPLPFFSRYGWFWKFIDVVDWEKFGKAMSCFVGEHDFRSFCKCDVDDPTIRKIDSIEISRFKENEALKSFLFPCGFKGVRIEIKGRGFLRYQIRRMIGAALDVARKKDVCVDFIKYQLKNPSDQQELTKAAGCGLCLSHILYK
jgi:tRNA pseudouridine38-40 synthase